MRKPNRLMRTFLALLFLVSIGVQPTQAAGRTNQTIANTVLNGKGAPTSKLGINGDFYIDVLTFNIYGPKANNKWPAPISLKGPAGAAGSDGKPGEKGNASSGSNGARGEQGEKGDKGEKGEKGDKGDPGEKGEKGETGAMGLTGAQGLKGDKGDTGAQGLKGDTGATGLQGLKGDTGAIGATGSQGLKGDTGLTGATGATGSQGLKGDKGDKGDTGSTGATGATGPSNTQILTIGSFTLSTSTPYTSASSSYVGTLVAGQSYKFEIIVRARTSNNSGRTGLDLLASGSGHSMSFSYITSSIIEVQSNSVWSGYQFLVIGTITVAAGGSSLAVSLIDGTGTSGSATITATGIASITLVGSVTGV